MKRKLSIKWKLTLWIMGFMALMAMACIGLIGALGGQVARREAFNTLSLTLRAGIPEISMDGKRLVVSQDFRFYVNDVYLLIYNKNQALLAGQEPPSFSVETPLENGVGKAVAGADGGFYVLDFWIPFGWEDGVWLRGIMRSPDGRRVFGNSLAMFFLIAPVFLVSAAVGGYVIAKRALDPVVEITEAAGSISGGQDLTRRLNLPDHGDEVSRLGDAFDRMFQRLEQAFEAEKQFTSDASHELRTPVSVILAQCDYVKKHGDCLEEYEEAVQVIERQARNMSQLIEGLLDMTRLDLGTRKLKMEPVDISHMAQVLCQELDTGVRGISIVPEITDGVVVRGDAFLISRVMVNLMENARTYGKENGSMVVRVFPWRPEGRRDWDCGVLRDGCWGTVQVEDDGIGIEAGDLDKIWQRFYQVESARSGSGLGLGLAMVRQIAGLHHGEAMVRSTPGKGSCFTVRFPADGGV